MELSKNRIFGIVSGLIAVNGKNVNLSTDANVHKSYLAFKEAKYFLKGFELSMYSKAVEELNLNSELNFKNLFLDESVCEAIHADGIGASIKFKFSRDTEKYNALKKQLAGMYTFDENQIEDPDNTFVIRNADGMGAVMFVYGGEEQISKRTHELSQLYHYETNTPYYDARPIKYSTWVNHPETRQQTRLVEVSTAI